MQGIIRLLRRQLVGRYRQRHTAGLQGQHNIMKTGFFQQTGMAQGAVQHSPGGHAALPAQNILLDAAGVHADADGHMMHSGAVRHPAHLFHAADIAGVDAHLGYAPLDGPHRQIGPEVDIRHQRHRRTVHNGGQRFQAVLIVHAQTHDVAPGLRQLPNLLQRGRSVPAVRIGHALHAHRRAAANGHFSNEKRTGSAHAKTAFQTQNIHHSMKGTAYRQAGQTVSRVRSTEG